jgi:hypothetical protein
VDLLLLDTISLSVLACFLNIICFIIILYYTISGEICESVWTQSNMRVVRWKYYLNLQQIHLKIWLSWHRRNNTANSYTETTVGLEEEVFSIKTCCSTSSHYRKINNLCQSKTVMDQWGTTTLMELWPIALTLWLDAWICPDMVITLVHGGHMPFMVLIKGLALKILFFLIIIYPQGCWSFYPAIFSLFVHVLLTKKSSYSHHIFPVFLYLVSHSFSCWCWSQSWAGEHSLFMKPLSLSVI